MQQLPDKTSPIARFMAVVLTSVVFALTLMVGAAVFLALIGVAAVALTVFYVRLRLRRAATARSRQAASGQIIEGEYVVERERARQR